MANFKKIAAAAAACILAATFTFGVAACKTDIPNTPPSEDPDNPGGDGSVVVDIPTDTYTLSVGQTYQLSATASDGSAITWTSSDANVATVSSSGLVTAVARGQAVITATSASGEEYADSCTIYVSGTLENVAGQYTYHSYFATSPGKWSPHTWESNTDSIILGYITMGFYDIDFTYDEDNNPDGTQFVPEMAVGEPVDVTSQYVGRYGVSAGDTAKAWEITLNSRATWEDGTPITADDYIYSMQQQLDPVLLNRRSDSYTSGTFTIYGAKDYLYSKTTATYESLTSQGYATIADALKSETVYIDMWNTWGLSGMVDENGNECPQWVSISDTVKYRDLAVAEGTDGDWISAKEIYEYMLSAYGEAGMISDMYVSVKVDNEHLNYTWDYQANGNGGVGLVKTADNKIVIILQNSISMFYLKYNLSSNWLVNKDLYEESKVTSGGVTSSTYCTSLDTTISYGPYKLTQYYTDQYFVLEKNTNWYGYTDGNHEDQFQTTRIDYTYISGENSQSIRKELFMQGKLEDYGLTGTEFEDYQYSNYLMSEPESYTYQFFLSTNLNALQAKDTATESHSVLSLTTFRKALSYAIERSQYIAGYSPTSEPGLSILNYLYISDPETGEVYRETEQGMSTVLIYEGFRDNGDGTWTDTRANIPYDSIEEAYDTLTGYDPEYAADLFEQAYAEAVEEGYYEDGQAVVIDYGTPAVGSTTAAMISLFNTMFAEVLELCDEPTFSEVRIDIDNSYGSEDAYWAAVKAGTVDLSFSAWGGAAMDPWGVIFSCYIDPNNSNNYGFDTTAKDIDIPIEYENEDITASLYDWAMWLYNGQSDDEYDETNLYEVLGVAVGDADYQFKLDVLSKCELAQMETYCNIPIFYSYVASIKSAKYNNGSDTYINNMIGYGSIRHITYNYDDAEWAAYVAQAGGNLEDVYLASGE